MQKVLSGIYSQHGSRNICYWLDPIQVLEEFLKVVNLKTFKTDYFPIENISFWNLINKETPLENDNHSSPKNCNTALAEDIYKDFSCLLLFLLV